MQKLIYTTILASLIFIAGCTGSQYDLDDPAAVVKGEEITVGDVLFVYNADDDELPHAVDTYVMEYLLMQEAKEMGIDVSEEVEMAVESMGRYPSEAVDTDQANQIRQFAESRADLFDMDPETYHEEYTRKRAELSQHSNAFAEEYVDVDELDTDENIEEADETMQQIINDLLEEYEDEIEVFIE
ncbi:hypothetical protein J2R98_000126 [Alkalibacillus filiformis]|uniref:SurA N-terminal domain-containing protein n=1 Tax=Alkalibacillus filiformis TaxID=200990 RepID=A0ABU0DPU2_9BACI|nr:hypothetical protein [Alkalibacillus filiformis]MDQ0350323.1 hypothetical protein [Alkalibacillus filiformis]